MLNQISDNLESPLRVIPVYLLQQNLRVIGHADMKPWRLAVKVVVLTFVCCAVYMLSRCWRRPVTMTQLNSTQKTVMTGAALLH